MFKNCIYTVEHGSMPLVILPSSINRYDLIDVSTVGSRFAKFISRQDGTFHDCEKYFMDYVDRFEAESSVCNG